ncbi:hypothetical protein [Kineosporia babensis]|uniref:Uncharacterized protein n=1 Tax=Kineosporia babensis TaxID=499548 RepID=A0A9X1SX67_9ACTN|nr:hypothetical protein [Kineosporia babensis]MCD5315897.1 hypothetical protein [Kineosporia babensis]
MAAPAAIWLSADSAAASRTIGVHAVQLRSSAVYELVSRRTRTGPSSTTVTRSPAWTVLSRVRTNTNGQFSTRFVVPLNWRHDHLIEVRKAKGADLVKGARDWLTVTPPRPALAVNTATAHNGSRVRVVVSGLRARARYEAFSIKIRSSGYAADGEEMREPSELRTFRTDADGRARFTITVPDDWREDHLVEVLKANSQTLVAGAGAWITVLPGRTV